LPTGSRILGLSALLLVTCTSTGALAQPAPDAPAPDAPAPDAPAPDAPAPTEPAEPDRPRVVESSPMPPIEKNPIDILPRDVLYPPNVEIQPKPILWRREWPRFSTADWIITGAGAALALAAAIAPPQSKHVYGGVLFDDDVRSFLRLKNPQARFNARDASDVLLSLEATWPFFVDAVITTWWFRGSPDAAAQMALVDGQALAIVTAVQGATNTIASRERPYGQVCGSSEQPDQTVECEGNVRHRSFFSGHAAFTFMSAGLICTHHLQHRFLRGAGDELACAIAYGGAAATATLRVMGDMHYATDVLTGAMVGGLIGVAVPLFHYRRANVENQVEPAEPEPARPGEPRGAGAGRAKARREGRRPVTPGVDMTLIPVGAGLGVGGTF